MEAGFSLGSNLGDRLQWLRWAKTHLLLDPQVQFVAQSSVYETEPVDVKDEYQQLTFLNAVLIVEGPYAAEEWLAKIKQVEAALQRKRTADRNAPRTIDVDLLFAGDQIVDSDLLTVPHPRWAERRFVLEPLAEVRGELVLPDSPAPVREMLARLPKSDAVRLFSDVW